MNDIRPSEPAQKQWSDWVSNGQRATSPDQGGDLRVWDERPLRPELINFCLADVIYLPRYEELLSPPAVLSANGPK